ncbi:MAG: metallophosphoesterase [Lachnospiraceae bacterium]|nr:metallophosphoesterase [Lachnospiraceae bacterium]
MKILVVSDTHRRDENLWAVIRKEAPFDMMIHMGDSEGSEECFGDWVRSDSCEIHVVRGNNDFFSRTPKDAEIEIGGHRAFLTHGHLYGVSMGTEILEDEARDRGVEIVMYGHTHKPHLEICADGLLILNPGSLSYPRQSDRKSTYAVMNLDENGHLEAQICRLEDHEKILEEIF